MKLDDLKPGWVYAVAASAYDQADAMPDSSLVYAATGDPVEFETQEMGRYGHKRRTQRVVVLHALSGGSWPTIREQSQQRRGLTIGRAVCPVADFPAVWAAKQAERAKAEADRAAAVAARQARLVALAAAVRAVGGNPESYAGQAAQWITELLNRPAEADIITKALEAAAAVMADVDEADSSPLPRVQ